MTPIASLCSFAFILLLEASNHPVAAFVPPPSFSPILKSVDNEDVFSVVRKARASEEDILSARISAAARARAANMRARDMEERARYKAEARQEEYDIRAAAAARAKEQKIMAAWETAREREEERRLKEEARAMAARRTMEERRRAAYEREQAEIDRKTTRADAVIRIREAQLAAAERKARQQADERRRKDEARAAAAMQMMEAKYEKARRQAEERRLKEEARVRAAMQVLEAKNAEERTKEQQALMQKNAMMEARVEAVEKVRAEQFAAQEAKFRDLNTSAKGYDFISQRYKGDDSYRDQQWWEDQRSNKVNEAAKSRASTSNIPSMRDYVTKNARSNYFDNDSAVNLYKVDNSNRYERWEDKISNGVNGAAQSRASKANVSSTRGSDVKNARNNYYDNNAAVNGYDRDYLSNGYMANRYEFDDDEVEVPPIEELNVLLDTAISASIEAGQIIAKALPGNLMSQMVEAGQMKMIADKSKSKTSTRNLFTDIIEAGQQIIAANMSGTEVSKTKANPRDLAIEIQSVIKNIIRAKFPDHQFLFEEDVRPGKDASALALQQKLIDGRDGRKSDYLWIVDPIDGTSNFVQGMPLCMPSIACTYKGETVIGVIFDPHRKEIFTAVKNHGARMNGEPIEVGKQNTIGDAIIAMGSPPGVESMQMSLNGIQRLMPRCRTIRMLGSAALMLAWVANGRLTAYWEYDLSSWNVAAGALLISEAGGKFTDLRNQEYNLTKRKICGSNGLIHDELIGILNRAGVE